MQGYPAVMPIRGLLMPKTKFLELTDLKVEFTLSNALNYRFEYSTWQVPNLPSSVPITTTLGSTAAMEHQGGSVKTSTQDQHMRPRATTDLAASLATVSRLFYLIPETLCLTVAGRLAGWRDGCPVVSCRLSVRGSRNR